MSIYRTQKRSPRSDVHHHVAERAVSPQSDDRTVAAGLSEEYWSRYRRASPADTLLPATAYWMATLPFEFRPASIADAFPRIANALASMWARPDAFASYMNDLLVDKRGGRSGFPIRVLRELHALRAYHAALPENSSAVRNHP